MTSNRGLIDNDEKSLSTFEKNTFLCGYDSCNLTHQKSFWDRTRMDTAQSERPATSVSNRVHNRGPVFWPPPLIRYKYSNFPDVHQWRCAARRVGPYKWRELWWQDRDGPTKRERDRRRKHLSASSVECVRTEWIRDRGRWHLKMAEKVESIVSTRIIRINGGKNPNGKMWHHNTPLRGFLFGGEIWGFGSNGSRLSIASLLVFSSTRRADSITGAMRRVLVVNYQLCCRSCCSYIFLSLHSSLSNVVFDCLSSQENDDTQS